MASIPSGINTWGTAGSDEWWGNATDWFWQELLPAIAPGAGYFAAGMPGVFAGSAYQQIANRAELERLNEENWERKEEALGHLETVPTFEEIMSRAGFDQPVGERLEPFRDMFTSADVFQEELPDFEPLDVEDFRYDPSELQELGARLGRDLRAGAVNFDTLLRQSGAEGMTERAEERFPDYGAYREERLGGIAEAAREAQAQARQEIAGQYGSLEEGETERGRREFAGNLASGYKGSAVEAEVMDLLRQQAETLTETDIEETKIRQGLAVDAMMDARMRGLAGAELEGQMFGRGEELEAGNLPLLADIERFNRTFPADIAARTAQFTSQDEAQAYNAMMSYIMLELQASLASAGHDVTLESLAARLLEGHTEAMMPFTNDALLMDWIRQQGIGGGGSGTQIGLSPTFGPSA